jgi:hypothetical protein
MLDVTSSMPATISVTRAIALTPAALAPLATTSVS